MGCGGYGYSRHLKLCLTAPRPKSPISARRLDKPSRRARLRRAAGPNGCGEHKLQLHPGRCLFGGSAPALRPRKLRRIPFCLFGKNIIRSVARTLPTKLCFAGARFCTSCRKLHPLVLPGRQKFAAREGELSAGQERPPWGVSIAKSHVCIVGSVDKRPRCATAALPTFCDDR